MYCNDKEKYNEWRRHVRVASEGAHVWSTEDVEGELNHLIIFIKRYINSTPEYSNWKLELKKFSNDENSPNNFAIHIFLSPFLIPPKYRYHKIPIQIAAKLWFVSYCRQSVFTKINSYYIIPTGIK